MNRTTFEPNNCVQATPGSALDEFLAQRAGAPDAERWAAAREDL